MTTTKTIATATTATTATTVNAGTADHAFAPSDTTIATSTADAVPHPPTTRNISLLSLTLSIAE